MGEYQWSGSDSSDLGYLGNWFPLQGGAIQEPGPNDVAIIDFGPSLTGTLDVGALDLVQQGPGEPALTIEGASTQVTASSAGVANTVTLESGALFQVGTLSTALGCDFLVTGANTSVDCTSTVSLAGTIMLTTGASMYAAALSIAGTSTVTVRAATLDTTVSTGNTMTIGSTAGTATLLLTGGANADFRSYDTMGDLNIGGINGSYATLTVNGQSSLISSPDNLVIGAGEDSNGLLTVSGAGSSATFECWGTVYVGVAPGATGTISVASGGYLLLDSGFGVVDDTSNVSAKIIVSGAGSEIDAGPSVNVGGQTVYDEAGTGEILVQSGGTFRAFDDTEVRTGSVVVTGAGSVFSTSDLEVFNPASLQVSSAGWAQIALINDDGGLVSLTGGTLSGLVDFNSQAGTLIGYGTLTAPKIINGGLLDAKGGTLHVTGAITGAGTMRIESGALLQLDNSSVASQSIVFESGANTLSLGAASTFAGSVLDFATGDAVDLLNSTSTTLSYATNALTVLNGTTKVATLDIKGSYAKVNFKLASDGHGGSLITYVASVPAGEPHPIGGPMPVIPYGHFSI